MESGSGDVLALWPEYYESPQSVRAVSPCAILISRSPATGMALIARCVDSEMLDMLHEAQRQGSVYVSFSHPDSLEGLEHVDAPEIGIMGEVGGDVEHLYRLHPQVRDLTIANAVWDPRVLLDLERFDSVRSLAVDHRQYRPGTRLAGSVRSFWVTSPREGSFADLPHGRGVEYLRVSQARKIASFAGLCEAYPAVVALDLYALPRLQGLDPVEELTAVRWLDVKSCSRLRSIEGVARMPHLEYLSMEDCKAIESIAALAGHPRVQRFVANGTTDISDGDLSPLTTMPRLTMVILRNRRHFHPSAAQIEAQPQLVEWEPWNFAPGD